MVQLTEIGTGAGSSSASLQKTLKRNDSLQATHEPTTARCNKYFANMKVKPFPLLPVSPYHPRVDRHYDHLVSNIKIQPNDTSVSSLLMTAWAIVLSWHSGSSDTLFGVQPENNVDSLLVPIRVNVDQELLAQEIVNTTQTHATEMAFVNKDELASILEAIGFQTAITRHWEDVADAQGDVLSHFADLAVTVAYRVDEVGLNTRWRFDSQVIRQDQIVSLAHQVETILCRLTHCDMRSTKIGDLSDAGSYDLSTIHSWNKHVPEPVNMRVDQFFAERVWQDSAAPAVCARDGDLTYGQLDKFSTKLAHSLVQMGMLPGSIVPLCFEKSMWVPVAILAVMKAGAACVLLDITQPNARLKSVVAQVSSEWLLTSLQQEPLARSLSKGEVVTVDQTLLDSLELLPPSPVTPRSPTGSDSPLYVVFTSGSTGVPKGVVVTHSNFCSAIRHQQSVMGFSERVRLFDFTSYAFDVAWANILHTLTSGGCLCIPSEDDRSSGLGVANAITALRANYLMTTPTLARLLDPADLSRSLGQVAFAGEKLTRADVDRWATQGVMVHNLYGPAECTVFSTMATGLESSINENSEPGIGYGVGVTTWVVQPDGKKLSAVGSVGELWLEGPLVSAGYLNDMNKTMSSFPENPEWLTSSPPIDDGFGRQRLYRTGDMVSYNKDGSLRFLGRRDTQVKLHGQRLELDEVNHHIGEVLPSQVHQARTEIITPYGSSQDALALFLALPSVDEADGIVTTLQSVLASRVAVYMIPTVFFALKQLPMTASGKTNRKALKQLGASVEGQNFIVRSRVSVNVARALTSAEQRLQKLWSTVLGRQRSEIGPEDSFLRLGGDSLAAMQLVAEARTVSIHLTVQDIFQHPKLEQLAQLVDTVQWEETKENAPLPYSLLRAGFEVNDIIQSAASACSVKVAEVEDVFPCTPLQEGLLAMTAVDQGQYISRILIQLAPNVDASRLQLAWTQVSHVAPVLRTRVVDVPGQGLVQVVLRQPLLWQDAMSLEDYQKTQIDPASMGLGTDLTRLGLVHDKNTSITSYLAWSQHHALYDGWSIRLLQEQLEQAYAGNKLDPLPSLPYLIRYNLQTSQEEQQRWWKQQFVDLEAPQFPRLPAATYRPNADKTVEHSIDNVHWPLGDLTASAILRAAWATLVAWQSGSSDSVFGAVVLGRQAAVPGIERLLGPTIATVPLRARVDANMTISQLLEQTQAQSIDMIAHEQFGLQHIRTVSEEAERACQFQSLLVVQPSPQKTKDQNSLFLQDMDDESTEDANGSDVFSSHALTITCQTISDRLELRLLFDSAVVSTSEVEGMTRCFEHIIRQFCQPENMTRRVRDLSRLSAWDRETIWRWNATPPIVVEACMHDLIAQRTQENPDAMAICAWDGELSYKELDTLSTRLAHRLVRLKVQPGSIVPLCFEKSMWVPVAKLAVMKAGAASVTLDFSQPEKRLQSIVRQAGSDIILSGESTAQLATAIAGTPPFIVSSKMLSQETNDDGDERETFLPIVKPSDLLYLVFTSGSTGVPKGAMITHANFATATKYHGPALGFHKASRVADFASYAFDVSWANFLNTLTAGGCLCIPSEEERRCDPVGFMARFNVNYVDLTPSVAAQLDLASLPQLETVVVGGELVELDKLAHIDHVKSLIITYGPAECTVTATAVDVKAQDYQVANGTIGSSCGATTWVVDPETSALLPVGAVGELLLEGPLNGLGYLHDSKKTAAVFVDDLPWLLEGAAEVQGRKARLYRTGDLVRYQPDGSLVFVERKDSQVKLRGQRVDLSEVELHVRNMLPADLGAQILAEVIVPDATRNPTLILFYTIPGVETTEEMEKRFELVAFDLGEALARQLPVFMLPTAYVPVAKIPISATGKTDRRAIRALGSSLSLETLVRDSKVPAREPTTEMEVKLQNLWSSVLGLVPSQINATDSFMSLGGDSIVAMRLASAACQQNLTLTVADILKHPRLEDLAQKIKMQKVEHVELQQSATIKPFSLLPVDVDSAKVRREAAVLCSKDASEVEDVFPCTALQAGMIALTTKSTGRYVQRTVLELKSDVDLDQFQVAWADVYAAAPILRTRLVHVDTGLVQVVLREPLRWHTGNTLAEYEAAEILDEESGRSMGLGVPLTRFGLVEDHAQQKRYFLWTQHHATYDGWALQRLQDALELAYAQEPIFPLPSIQHLIRHIINQDHLEEAKFWKQQFADLDASQWPVLLTNHEMVPNGLAEHTIHGLDWPTGSITAPSLMRAAWAMLLSWYSASVDVVFGAVVLGRQGSVPDIEQLVGPTIATVPIRVAVDEDLTIQDYLLRVQGQAAEMIQYEQTGLQNISQLGGDAQRACQFQTLLVVQSSETSDDTKMNSAIFADSHQSSTDAKRQELSAFNSEYPISLTCDMQGSDVRLHLGHDSTVLDADAANRLLHQLEHILRQLCLPESDACKTQLSDMSWTSEDDLATIWTRNATVPDMVESCVHQVFAQRVQESPLAPAVCAWDGDLTFAELDRLSTRLAHHLIELGVQTGDIIPIYFEKSMWVPVAILAVMKAGGAGVTLDSALPVERLRGIVEQVAPPMLLTSTQCHERAPQISSKPAFAVSAESMRSLEAQNISTLLPDVDPTSPLYLVFTSGSTGQPKGAIATHRNFCSSAKHHQGPLGLDRSSRIFEFTSYAFDVAWSNILHSITVGGCLCIPSDEDRASDVAGAMQRLGVNFVHITPTVANMLDPMALPSLDKLLFTGEALKRSDVAKWKDNKHVQFYNTYGPAECTVTSTVEAVRPYSENEKEMEPTIGKPYGTLAWIVRPSGKGLTAFGTPGELWIEGPTVGGGYLNNPEKTAAAFVTDPAWLTQGAAGVPGRRGRLYRTGDMAKLKADGSVIFLGRKDTQVKINGQRIELGEVDFHVLELLPPHISQIATEIVVPEATMIPTLALFIAMSEEDTLETVSTLRVELSKRLPPSMVPTAYITLPTLPMTPSGKTDRKGLRELGQTWTPPSFTELQKQAISDVPLTADESILREIWAKVLRLDCDLISPHHSFSALGGDSIKSMSLAMAIRKQWNLTVPIHRLLGSQDTLGGMAGLLATLARGQRVENAGGPDLNHEVAALTHQLRFGTPGGPKPTVFLTGVTGYLGIHILRQIVKSQLFGKIALHVRASTQEAGLARVKEAADAAGWSWAEMTHAAIEIWEGDLSAPQLGLTEARWLSLCGVPSSSGVVNVIIHNGAAVDWSTSYEKLKAVNVNSTLQLLQAAVSSTSLKRFVFVSGGLSAKDWSSSELDAANQATGYDQTKYISEKLVIAAAAQRTDHSHVFSIVKPGLIIGDADLGRANPDDFIWRLVAAAVRIKARPIEAIGSWLAVADVTAVACSVLQHVTTDQPDQFVELDQGMHVDAFWTAVQDQLQEPLQLVSWKTWMDKANKDMTGVGETHPLWPVQQFLGQLGSEDMRIEPHGIRKESNIDKAVRSNVSYLQKTHVVDGKESWHHAATKLRMRTKLART